MHYSDIINSKKVAISLLLLLLLFVPQSSLKKTKRSKNGVPVLHVTRRQSDVTSGSTAAIPTIIIDDAEDLTKKAEIEPDVDVLDDIEAALDKCPGRCVSCDLINGCTKCKHRMFLYLDEQDRHRQVGFCVHTCPHGYFGSRGKENSCKKCQVSNCASCFTSNYCTTCKKGFFLHDALCVKTCPSGMVPDEDMEKCVERIDCEVGSWSSWSECAKRSPKKSCKYGKKKRTRVVVNEPSENGKQCPKLKETKRCRTPANKCPLFNKWYQKQLKRRDRRERKKGRKGRRKGRREEIRNNDTQQT